MSQIQQPPPVSFHRPTKTKSTALILELLPGLFGFYGIGWIYADKVGLGVSLLIGGIVWAIIAITIDTITAGIGLLCTLPINIAAVTISSISINNYTKQHPEIFG